AGRVARGRRALARRPVPSPSWSNAPEEARDVATRAGLGGPVAGGAGGGGRGGRLGAGQDRRGGGGAGPGPDGGRRCGSGGRRRRRTGGPGPGVGQRRPVGGLRRGWQRHRGRRAAELRADVGGDRARGRAVPPVSRHRPGPLRGVWASVVSIPTGRRREEPVVSLSRRRVRRVIRRIEPWSVLRFSIVFYAC